MPAFNPDDAPVAEGAAASDSVPVIDLGGVAGVTDPAEIARVAGEIGEACRDWGFFQVVNHGVSAAHLALVWDETAGFFALPRPVKRALERTHESPWGYFDRELTKNIRDKKEIFDIGPEVDAAQAAADPFSGATPWPAERPGFEPALRAHFEICADLSQRLLRAISRGLDLPADRLDRYFAGGHTSFLRLNYYPVEDPLSDLPESARDGADLGVHHHSDSGALTVLMQDQVGGLQVFKDGLWHNVAPLKGAFVINIGDMVQVWSNDRYRAALHRVVAMERTDRYSIPFFFNPSYDSAVDPLVDLAEGAHYSAIHWGEFRRKRADGDFADTGKEVQIADYRR
ncbi:MAG: 2OG-Fe(II) oxygenase family protein [Pseudomonadota bacterium]|nr:2OG-Fe(II) oxygenase family protein [Pseudomonadota bacterium]